MGQSVVTWQCTLILLPYFPSQEKQRLLSQLEIGMRVERRYDNSEW